MTKVFTLWALILICCSSAFADDGCTADTNGYTEKKLKTRKPIFVPSAKSVEKILPSKLNKYGFEDKMLLKDGTEVVFTVGGCAHYSYSYTFFGKAIKKIKDGEKLNRAKSS